MKILHLSFPICLLIILSCSDNDSDHLDSMDDLNEYEAISGSMLYNTLNPEENYDYFEFRLNQGDTFIVLHSSGTKCLNSIDSMNCVNNIDTIRPNNFGFGETFQHIAFYFVSQKSAVIATCSNVSELKAFLGTIETQSDALMFAFGYGYIYDYNNKNVCAIKTTNNGYRIIALKYEGNCESFEIYRCLLSIDTIGTIEILDREYYGNGDCY